MSFLQVTNLSLSYGERELLKNINLNLSEKSRIAVAGANGCGKSTFLKILAGIGESDGGAISFQKGTTTGYLPQSGLVHEGRTLYEEAETAFEDMRRELEKANRLGENLKNPSLNEEETNDLIERLHLIHERAETSGYYNREGSISRILTGLGFLREQFKNDVATFSGGWQMRIALAKLLLKSPDFLLLDEPTNYLDLEARNWLEDFLGSYHGGVVLVSHDRFFFGRHHTRGGRTLSGSI
jgi:ATP-binding cassette subfamily F protein 3